MKICLLYNFAQHYRLAIYKKLDSTFDIDFYFGKNRTDIKPIGSEQLENIKQYFERVKIYKSLYYLKGTSKLSSLPYTHYIFLAEYFNLTNWILLFKLKLKKKKIILWTHGLYGEEPFIKRKIIKYFLNFGDKILTYNNRGKLLLLKEGISKDKIEVIYNSLDVETQNKVYSSLTKSKIYYNHFGNSNKVLVYIGRIQYRKKIEQVLYAIKALEENYNIEYNFVIIGDGKAKSSLKSLAVKLNIDKRVWFHGALYDEREIGELLYNADLAISPGNIGLTAMHCFVYGLPFVTHNNFSKQMPEYEIMEENITGVFFKENDVEDLAKKINEWFGNQLDREIVEKKCRAQILKHYNPDYQLEIFTKCINQLK